MIGHYQGNVAAARRSWATAHRKEVVGFTRAYVAAIDWLYDGTNREEAERILTGNLPQMSRELARTSYDLLLDRNGGFLFYARAKSILRDLKRCSGCAAGILNRKVCSPLQQ
jgi:hypothetical protein